jgi:hypothetical protein
VCDVGAPVDDLTQRRMEERRGVPYHGLLELQVNDLALRMGGVGDRQGRLLHGRRPVDLEKVLPAEGARSRSRCSTLVDAT